MLSIVFVFCALLLTAANASAISPLVVGGDEANLSDWPFVAALMVNDEYTCTATIIDKNFLLTAGNCIREASASNVTVRVGSRFRSSGGSVITVQSIRVHKDINKPYWNGNNIALIKTSEELVIVKNSVETVRMTEEGTEVPIGAPLALAGWGRVKSNSDYFQSLLSLVTRSISITECKSMSIDVVPSVQCASLRIPGYGACVGDNGGPVVYNGKLIGVLSSVSCGSGETPDMYTDIQQFQQWIEEAMNEL